MKDSDSASLREAAAAVRRSYRDEDAYVFLPESDERHFLVEAVLIGIGGTLVRAFLKGLCASVEGGVEQWGKDLGTWLIKQTKGLVEADDPTQTASAELAPVVAQSAGLSTDPSDEQLSQDLLETALISCGMTKRVAQTAAAAASEQGMQLRANAVA